MHKTVIFTDRPIFSRAQKNNTWREAIRAAVRSIAADAKKPLWLAFSGGTDSEIMCRAFHSEHIAFTAITFSHADGANREEVAYARQWCWDRGIPHETIPFATETFFAQAAEAFPDFPSHNMFRYFQREILNSIDERGGHGVIGDGGILLYADLAREKTVLCISETEKLLHASTPTHTAQFFSCTPELVYSYLHHPVVAAATKDASLFQNDRNRYLFKRFIFQALWPEISERPKKSMFGHFAQVRRGVESKLKERFPHIEEWRIPVDEALAMLSPR